MNFYTSIAPFYRYIFPIKPAQVKFVQSYTGLYSNPILLDIGCALGDLPNELVSDFDKIEAIDFDKEMISLAKPVNENVHFRFGDMLNVHEYYGKAKFDMLTCFGNTLVHLGSVNQVREFIEISHVVLKSKGILLIQIINYDNVVAQELNGLPTIENEKLSFKRIYEFADNNKTVKFDTILNIKSDKVEIKNSIILLALRKSELKKILLEVGFDDIKLYSNFNKQPVSNQHLPLIIEARKK